MILELQEENGDKQPAIGVPVKLSETPGSVRSPAVDFGENTISILKELGYTEKEIRRFTEAEVI
jgi:crotonobetainyl-CoA:carnitine CoA-transferase CaiB-like acyl-CoA transferase